MEISVRTVERVKYSDKMQPVFDDLRAKREEAFEDAVQRIGEEQHRCVQTLIDLRDDENSSRELKARICQDLLDRGGISPIKTIRKESLEMHLTPKNIKELIERAKNAQEARNKALRTTEPNKELSIN